MIPEQLLNRLNDLRPVLCTSGSVLVRREKDRKRAYRLRVRVMDDEKGYRRQLSISVGDAFRAGAVNAMLQEWRVAHAERVAAADGREEADARRGEKAERQRLRREAQDLGGGGRRRRRAIGKRFDEAVAKGAIDEWTFFACAEYAQPNKRAGHRRKGGLTIGETEQVSGDSKWH